MWTMKKQNRFSHKKRILKRLAGEVLLKENSKIYHLSHSTEKATYNFLQKEKERIHLNENAVRLLNPENILKRGYTLTFSEGIIIKSVKSLAENETIETRFSDGKIKSKIIKKRE
jgi:exodeoxyribonuclease VII large subunit